MRVKNQDIEHSDRLRKGQSILRFVQEVIEGNDEGLNLSIDATMGMASLLEYAQNLSRYDSAT